jgi:hypothetical protein
MAPKRKTGGKYRDADGKVKAGAGLAVLVAGGDFDNYTCFADEHVVGLAVLFARNPAMFLSAVGSLADMSRYMFPKKNTELLAVQENLARVIVGMKQRAKAA